MSKLLPAAWNVPDRFRARLGSQAGRQRTMVHEGHLLIIVHGLPEPGELTRKASFFWRAPDGTWKSTGIGKAGLKSLKEHLEVFDKEAQALETRVEQAQRAADYFSVLQAAGPFLRTARGLHKTLQEAREAVAADSDIIALRDQANDVERAAELVHSDAKNGLDFTIARQAEEQAESSNHIAQSSHRLNLLAALFFPITALGTMFSMQLKNGLETQYAPWLFWGVLVFAFLFGLVLRAGLKPGGQPSS